jgi:hypothetical protein
MHMSKKHDTELQIKVTIGTYHQAQPYIRLYTGLASGLWHKAGNQLLRVLQSVGHGNPYTHAPLYSSVHVHCDARVTDSVATECDLFLLPILKENSHYCKDGFTTCKSSP